MAADTTDPRAAAAADNAMSHTIEASLRMRLTPRYAPSAADSARAARLVAQMRQALEKYRDVRAAVADGFREFLPGVPQPIYHFTNWASGLGAMFGFEATRPTSLLYRRTEGGGFELVGAMYTAPARASDEELDRRIPLSVARWHQHVNWCVPPRGADQRWRETQDGAPRFGPASPIATGEACDAVGGRFLPRIFGWMVHVQAFAGDDPAAIWGDPTHQHVH